VEASQFFLELAIILVAARLAAETATRFGAPAVIGELIAGVILGPSVLGWIEVNEIIQLLAEVGVILLLFDVGLETDLGRLLRSGRSSTLVALGGVLFPFLLSFLLCFYGFNLPLLLSLFVGGTMTATSIGITVRVLRDEGRQNSPEGQIVLGAAVLDDVLGVLLLAVLYDLSHNAELEPAHLMRLVLFIGLFFLLAPVAAKAMSAIIAQHDRERHMPGLVSTVIVSLVMFFAWLAHTVGAPELLGGFAAGLALSRRFFLPFGAMLAQDERFGAEIEHDIRPIVQLFTPIFFVTVGLSLDLRAVDWGSMFIWAFSLSLAFLAIIGKIAGGFLLFREHWLMKSAVGMAMVPRGEVGLIFAELGRAAGVFDESTYAAVVVVIAYTTLFSPFWIKLFYRIYGHRAELVFERRHLDPDGKYPSRADLIAAARRGVPRSGVSRGGGEPPPAPPPKS
jgi:Kef-type K+ transport system membrane component KefB